MINWIETSVNFSEEEKGEITMCEIVDQFIARGVSQGIEQGIAQGENKRDEEYKTALELKESGNTNVSDYRDKGISDEVIKNRSAGLNKKFHFSRPKGRLILPENADKMGILKTSKNFLKKLLTLWESFDIIIFAAEQSGYYLRVTDA